MSSLWQLRRPRNNSTTKQGAPLGSKFLFIIPFSNKRNKGSSEKCLRQEIHKMSMDRLVLIVGRERSSGWKRPYDGSISKGHRGQLKKLPRAKEGKIQQQNLIKY